MNTLKLRIITPEKIFFEGEAQSLTFSSLDGELEILAGHAPMVAHLEAGALRVKVDGVRRSGFTAQGFVETTPESTMVFSQACEWPEEIDAERAQAALEKYERILRQSVRLEERRHAEQMIGRSRMRLEMSQWASSNKKQIKNER